MDSKTPKDRAAELDARQKNSVNWLRTSFYGEWEDAYKSYKCIIDQPTKDDKGKDADPDRMAVAMPDTWSLVRRQVARVTAQPPNLKTNTRDQDLADRINRKLMRDWDLGGTQRQQKRHVMQASIFGWSVRGWYWDRDLVRRSKRVDPFSKDPSILSSIAKYYQLQVQSGPDGTPMLDPMAAANLVQQFGRGGLVPIKYDYVGYEGPRAETLFIGDCFPEPNFQQLQKSKWFGVRRRRSKAWLEQLVTLYPELGPGVQDLLDRFPNGTPDNPMGSGDDQLLRRNMLTLLGRADSTAWSKNDSATGTEPEFTLFECHEPGVEPKQQFLAEGSIYLGEIDYPYELEGRIAFTDLVLIDDLLSGIGDSHARIIRGLQRLHERMVNTRMDLIHNILRPLVWVANRELYEQPDLLKRGDGFRLVPTFGPNDMGILGEQAAAAAAAASLGSTQEINQLIQQASGESNMSLQANVDPQQNRTATGARLMAYNSDILTKDVNDAFTDSSLAEDVRTMYLLNRSEMPSGVEFDAAKYIRSYDPRNALPEQDYITVTPEDFQHDDVDVIVEANSTLSDDDETKVTKAQTLFQAAMGAPQIFNQETARDEFLIAMGKGKQLQKWAAPPPPPPPPPHPEPPKVSIAMKFELLPIPVQENILIATGLLQPGQSLTDPMAEVGAAPPPGAGPGPAPGGPGGGAGPAPAGGPPAPVKAGTPPNIPTPPPTPDLPLGGATAAAEGRHP